MQIYVKFLQIYADKICKYMQLHALDRTLNMAGWQAALIPPTIQSGFFNISRPGFPNRRKTFHSKCFTISNPLNLLPEEFWIY